MTARLKSEVLSLAPGERIRLIEELWDSLAADPANVPVTPEQMRELDARLDDQQRNPGDESSWDDVRDNLRKSK